MDLIENPFFAGHQTSQAPGVIHGQRDDVMLSGGVGDRAIQIFKDFRIGASTRADSTIRATVEKYLAGELNEAAPCAESIHHGRGEGNDHRHH